MKLADAINTLPFKQRVVGSSPTRPIGRKLAKFLRHDSDRRVGIRCRRGKVTTPTWAWADLMRRVFAIDVLACAGCGGRLRFLATSEDPPVVAKIPAHLGLPTARPTLIHARSPPSPDAFDFP